MKQLTAIVFTNLCCFTLEIHSSRS